MEFLSRKFYRIYENRFKKGGLSMRLKDRAVVKNLARLLKIEGDQYEKGTRAKIEKVTKKMAPKHEYEYSPGTIENILSGKSGGPNEVLQFRLSHHFDIDNPEDLNAPDDFIKLRVIVDASNLPEDKKESLRMVLDINNPERLKVVKNLLDAQHKAERKEFDAEVQRKIEEWKGRKDPLPDKEKDKGFPLLEDEAGAESQLN
jgi:hypothetical protein